VETPLVLPAPDQILIRNHYLGVNASDVNYVSGKYTPGIVAPFDVGFESLGQVVAIGDKVTKFKIGDSVAVTAHGSYAEYFLVKENAATLLPGVNPEFLPLFVSGLTASLAWEYTAELKTGETVLVTAAAGGTGQFAVQLAKLAGNHVIGTCSSDEKVEFLKQLGCDRAINYKKENLSEVLQKEYPNGVNVVYESVGGEVFDVCVKHLAVLGRLVVIGMVSGYESGSAFVTEHQSTPGASTAPLPLRLLRKSASVRGFFMYHFAKHFSAHMHKLLDLYGQGKIKSVVDAHFKGLEQVADAVEFLFKGGNKGKVIVDISP